MIEGAPWTPLQLAPGPERRALLREMKMPIGRGDFSDAEWAEIEAEAPGMWAELQAMLDDPAHG